MKEKVTNLHFVIYPYFDCQFPKFLGFYENSQLINKTCNAANSRISQSNVQLYQFCLAAQLNTAVKYETLSVFKLCLFCVFIVSVQKVPHE